MIGILYNNNHHAKKKLSFLCSFFIIGFLTCMTFFESAVIVTQALTIEPTHDKPCVVGDAWAEECMSCVCSEGRIATCKPSFCATRLKRDLDDCKEGEVTKIDCNTCRCKGNVKVCTKYDCGKKDGKGNIHKGNRDARKLKKNKEKMAKRFKGKV